MAVTAGADTHHRPRRNRNNADQRAASEQPRKLLAEGSPHAGSLPQRGLYGKNRRSEIPGSKSGNAAGAAERRTVPRK